MRYEDAGKDVGIVDRVVRKDIRRSGSRENGKARVDRHDEMRVIE